MLGKLRNVLPAAGSTIYVFERKDTLMEMLTTLAMLAAAFTLTMSLAACGASVDASDAADEGDRLEVSDEEVRHPETQKGPSLAENMLANRSGENRRYLQQVLEAADRQLAARGLAFASVLSAYEPVAVSSADDLRAQLDITEDYRDSFVHGEKGAEYQKYIVLHDTEGEGSAAGVVAYWDGNGAGVAAHFIINKDGTIVQCVPLDKITHHAGFGDTGHNELYGVQDESRDDKMGTVPIGDWAADYGMNSYSIGIEMVHVGGSGDYPEAQLEALDGLIAYIDAYYGFESAIIDHKAWRTGNSDTSPEFAGYLSNYQDHRTHN
ncbi:N-acetylmuramoyl-L-alanine amidase [Slackia heliotrinireducens]|nr:peptidoglycan recognition family protein [Slackia heliotrinireducens]